MRTLLLLVFIAICLAAASPASAQAPLCAQWKDANNICNNCSSAPGFQTLRREDGPTCTACGGTCTRFPNAVIADGKKIAVNDAFVVAAEAPADALESPLCQPIASEGATFFALELSTEELRNLASFSPWVAMNAATFRDLGPEGVYPFDLRGGDSVAHVQPTVKSVLSHFAGVDAKRLASMYELLPQDTYAESTWQHANLSDGTEGLVFATRILTEAHKLVSVAHSPVMVRIEPTGVTRPVPQFEGRTAQVYRITSVEWFEAL